MILLCQLLFFMFSGLVFCLFLFFFSNLFLEDNCFTILCCFLLYNNMNQIKCTYIPFFLSLPLTLCIPPLCVITDNRAEFPVPYSGFPLAIYFIRGSIYILMLISQFFPPFPSPTVLTSLFFMSISLCSCPVNRFISTIFLDSIYMLKYDICFSLSDLLHSMTDASFIHLTTSDDFVPFYGWVICIIYMYQNFFFHSYISEHSVYSYT